MKLTDLRPCDSCGGALIGRTAGYGGQNTQMFHVIRCTRALVHPQAVNQVLGLNQYFGGNALGLAEIFAPQPNAITVLVDKEPELQTELFLCEKCVYGSEGVDLLDLIEKRNNAKAKAEEEKEARACSS